MKTNVSEINKNDGQETMKPLMTFVEGPVPILAATATKSINRKSARSKAPLVWVQNARDPRTRSYGPNKVSLNCL